MFGDPRYQAPEALKKLMIFVEDSERLGRVQGFDRGPGGELLRTFTRHTHIPIFVAVTHLFFVLFYRH